jgi:dolichol kinase
MEFQSILIYTVLFLAIFGLGEIMYHKLKVKPEITRKFSHFSSGILALSFYIYLTEITSVAVLCTSFLGLLILSKKFGFLKSINNVDRITVGSFLFPVSVFGCFVLAHFSSLQQHALFFYLPILTLAICDPLSALVGKKFPYGKYKVGINHKTIMGSSAFLISALLLGYVLSLILKIEVSILTIGISALLCTFIEGISRNGWDNLTIPTTSAFSIWVLTLF